MFLRDEKVVDAIGKEVDIISKSIMNVENMFIAEDQSQSRDLIIKSEDLLIKLLTFLEFWKQKGANLHASVFIIKSLYNIIQNKEDIAEMVEAQEILDSLNATKICLLLIWQDNENNNYYLYHLIQLGIWLLEEGNKRV